MEIFEISKFPILPHTQNRKLGNHENLSFTSNFDSSCNPRFENNKNWTETKTESSRYVIKGKNKHFWVFRVFDFCSITKIEILEILEMLFTSNFDTGCNSRSKNDKKMNWVKNWKVPIWFRRKMKISEVSKFSIWNWGVE